MYSCKFRLYFLYARGYMGLIGTSSNLTEIIAYKRSFRDVLTAQSGVHKFRKKQERPQF
jgi:hypothetical protein